MRRKQKAGFSQILNLTRHLPNFAQKTIYTMAFRLITLLICLGITACTLQQKDVAGVWQAVAFYENGKTVAAPLDSVRLKLSPEGGYEFKSQGFYSESGQFRVSARFLFLNDTTREPAKEHIVKVLHLSEDSLKIQMSREDKEQVLFLAKVESFEF